MAIKLTDTVSVNESDWLEPQENSSSMFDDEDIRFAFEEFLIKSPSVGCSCLAKDFIDGQRVTTSALAEVLRNHLLEKVEFEFFDGSPNLKSEISKVVVGGSDVWRDGEYAYLVLNFPNAAIDRFKELDGCRQRNAAYIEKEAEKIVLERFKEVDSIYRHLRNALAHGTFKKVYVSNEKGLFLYDLNRDGNLSAVMFLTFARLKNWRQLRCQMRNG